MSTAMVFLLVAIGGSNSAPATLAVLSDLRACNIAAESLYSQSKARTGSANIYAYCIPVLAAAVVK